MRKAMGRTNNMLVDKGCHGVRQALYLCMRDFMMGWGLPWDRSMPVNMGYILQMVLGMSISSNKGDWTNTLIIMSQAG